MSQNSTDIVDSNGVTFLANLNLASDTLRTNGSGPTAPATPSAGWPWLDTTLNLFKIRNTGNTTWKTVLDDEGIHASTSKTTPVDADEVSILDSASSYSLKKLTWANIKATLKTYFDTLYVALAGDQTVAGIKTFSSFPVTPSSAPTSNYEVANKKYVDDATSFTTTNFLHIQDQKTSGTAGGAGTSATETTRDLNTVLSNSITGASLATNLITLPAGTYFIQASAQAYSCNKHKLFLKETTNYLLYGTSENASNTYGGNSRSFASGKIVLATTTDVYLAHYIQSHVGTSDYGIATSDGQIEVYSDIKIWKVA